MTLAYIVYFGLIAAMVALWIVPARAASLGPAVAAHAGTRAAIGSILLFTLIIGGRYNVGGDFFGYIDYYRFSLLSDRTSDVPFEPGFLLLIKLLKLFSLPDRSIIFASSFIQIALLSLWLRKHPTRTICGIDIYYLALVRFQQHHSARNCLRGDNTGAIGHQ